jgi:hypothetical protein
LSAEEAHNYDLPSNIGDYSTARKIMEEEKAIVGDVADAGATASVTLSYLFEEKHQN